MSLLEIVAVFFSLVCVVLSVRKNVLNWPVGLIGVGAYLLLFYKHQLYADMVLQVFFIGQGLYGWYNWHTNKETNETVQIEELGLRKFSVWLLATFAITVLWGFLLKTYTDDSVPYLDSFVSSLSFTANILMARRKVENWLLWIAANIGYTGLFIYKQLYLSSGVYAVFLILAVIGWLEWRKQLDTKRVSY